MEMEEKLNEIREELKEKSGEEFYQRVYDKIDKEMKTAEANSLPVSERVNQFARLNYLLDCMMKTHTCDLFGRVSLKTLPVPEKVEIPVKKEKKSYTPAKKRDGCPKGTKREGKIKKRKSLE